jgi:hypothetical protein
MKRINFKSLVLLIALFFVSYSTDAQLQTFHKLYKTDFFTHCYDVAPTLDYGYIITGFEDKPAPFNFPLVPYLCKIDCNGEVEWLRKYGQTTGLDNSDPRVTTLNNGDYIMMNTVLEQSYDILLVRTTPNGEAVWKKTYGGFNKDVGRGMIKLKDNNLLVVGSTYSYGTDISTFYSDMYALKINSVTGDTIWTKTYGNAGGIDDLWGITEGENGELTFVGRSFYDNGIWLSVIHTDMNGDILWAKNYGKTNHHAQGFDIIGLDDGGFVFTGFTTLAKQDFNSLSDIQVIRVRSNGEIIWAKVFHGSSPDLSELGSSIVSTGDTLAIALEATSYPTPNADITKQLLYLLDTESGDLLQAKSFNSTGGQFPMIRKDWSGYIMSGMTDEFDGSWNDPILRKLDNNFSSGCQETDWTMLTVTEEPIWNVEDANFSVSNGSFSIDYLADSLATNYVDSTLCFSGETVANCEMITSTEQVPSSAFSIRMFPNPTTDRLHIQFSQRLEGSAYIRLFNTNGQEMMNLSVQNELEYTLDISELPSGLYFLQVQDAKHQFVEKLEKI